MKEGSPLRILTVADLRWQNGHEFALLAARLLQRRGVALEYRLVGQGPFLEAVGYARHALGLEDCVALRLAESEPVTEQHYTWADVFLLAAVADGGGHGLAKALARRLPVVCTDACRLPEDGPPALCYVAARRDPQALADGVMQLIHAHASSRL